jgi:hypothetical protein
MIMILELMMADKNTYSKKESQSYLFDFLDTPINALKGTETAFIIPNNNC